MIKDVTNSPKDGEDFWYSPENMVGSITIQKAKGVTFVYRPQYITLR